MDESIHLIRSSDTLLALGWAPPEKPIGRFDKVACYVDDNLSDRHFLDVYGWLLKEHAGVESRRTIGRRSRASRAEGRSHLQRMDWHAGGPRKCRHQSPGVRLSAEASLCRRLLRPEGAVIV